MVTIRSVNELTLSLIDFFKLNQPLADTKAGTVIRNIAVDAPSNQTALLYDELSKVSNQQSIRLAVGSDLIKLLKNYGLSKKNAVASNGVGLLTFSSIPATIAIDVGDVITAANGFTFTVTAGISVIPAQINFYKSIATKYANDLAFVGITDQYAVQVSLQASTPGSAGNIPQYSLNSTSIPGVSNVTNVTAFQGGTDQETDAAFRNRGLALFSGSSVGTSLGYKNTALAVTGVLDVYVAGPNDPLMTRDGTIVTADAQGNLIIITEGTGGKVDVYALGTNLQLNTDSFIYQDKSNKNDPTNSKNNYVLGQIASDAGKTFNQKRLADIAAGVLPSQPVDSIIQVTGSLSGSNFLPKSVDANGVISGNYELIKDTSVYAGSNWGFDTFAWISNQIVFNEDLVKGKPGGQDPVTYSDVLTIPEVQQNISITNENSNVLTTNNSLIQLLHTPATAVTRVYNVNTGETYTITNQNPNGTGTTNTSGVIQITGNTLPSQSDVLQVDYTWVVTFDNYIDYDGLVGTNNARVVNDSVDWGYSNLVRSERINYTLNSVGGFFYGTTSLPINAVLNAYLFQGIDGYVSTVATGVYTGRLAITISNLFTQTTAVNNVFLQNTKVELYNTAQNNGTFTSLSTVVGITLEYITTIILPTDTVAVSGAAVTVILNAADMYNITNSTGNFTGTQINIPSANFASNFPATLPTNLTLNTVYVSNVQNMLSTGITNVPLSRIGNGFVANNSNGFNNYYPQNVSRRENQTVQSNGTNFYVELNLSNIDANLDAYQVVSVIRLSDGYELWSRDNIGTIAVNSNTTNYQLIFNGFGPPVLGDRILAIYYATYTQRFQPFTFGNYVYERDFQQLNVVHPILNSAPSNITAYGPLFSVPIHQFTNASNVSFYVLEPNTNYILAKGNDGVLTSNGISATFTSASVNFGRIQDISGDGYTTPTLKKIRIVSPSPAPTNNSGIYDIMAFNTSNNIITIQNDYSQINNRNVSIIRIRDGQELWSDAGMISVVNNTLTFPTTANAIQGDKVIVMFYSFYNIKQAETKLGLTITDQVVNTGTLSVMGTTITKAENIIFSSTTTSPKQNLLGAIRTALGLVSNAAIPSNIKLVKIANLQRVTTTNGVAPVVLETVATYDIIETTINDNSFFANQFYANQSLGPFDFILPATNNNLSNLATQNSVGDQFQITFYYATTNDMESVAFTRNGTLYTNKNWALINKVYVSSGFNVSQSAKLTISNFNQPITGSRYTAYYNYLAPKQSERIIIQSNYNAIVGSVTFALEANRPITADVLAKESDVIDIDVTMNIVVTSQYSTSSALVIQNVKDAVAASINANGLGFTLDQSAVQNAAFGVAGVGAARPTYFNVTGVAGSVLSVAAHNNQYFSANNIIINQVSN
jgi:hypothetical protein